MSNLNSDKNEDLNPCSHITWMKWILLSILALWYFYHSMLTTINDTTSNSSKILASQVESLYIIQSQLKIITANSKLYKSNMNAFNVSRSTKVCAQCHLKPSMYIRITDMTPTVFKQYVRGNNNVRHNSNVIMPHFDFKMISDADLEEMYMILKYSFNITEG